MSEEEHGVKTRSFIGSGLAAAAGVTASGAAVPEALADRSPKLAITESAAVREDSRSGG